MTGNTSTRAVGTEASGRSEPKSPTPMGGASVSEVLAAAADLLEKPGAWTQGIWVDHKGCLCIEGAIATVVGIHPSDVYSHPASIELEARIGSLVDWNDAPGRTQAEVVTALRQAARQASNPTAEGV
jgi:hypothetical protein